MRMDSDLNKTVFIIPENSTILKMPERLTVSSFRYKAVYS